MGTPTAFAVCPRRVHGRRDPDRVDVRMRQRLVAILHVGEARGFPRPESLPTPRIPADAGPEGYRLAFGVALGLVDPCDFITVPQLAGSLAMQRPAPVESQMSDESVQSPELGSGLTTDPAAGWERDGTGQNRQNPPTMHDRANGDEAVRRGTRETPAQGGVARSNPVGTTNKSPGQGCSPLRKGQRQEHTRGQIPHGSCGPCTDSGEPPPYVAGWGGEHQMSGNRTGAVRTPLLQQLSVM